MPVADGAVVVVDGDPARAAHATDTELMVGSTTHEWSLMLAGQPWYAGLCDADAAARLGALLTAVGAPGLVIDDDDARRLIGAVRERHPDEHPALLLMRVLSAHTFGREAAVLADAHVGLGSVYRYDFAYESDARPGPLGATHCIDVPCAFGTVRWTPLVGDRPERWELESAVMDAWLRFAETGRPADERAWPAWTGVSSVGRRFGDPSVDVFTPSTAAGLDASPTMG